LVVIAPSPAAIGPASAMVGADAAFYAVFGVFVVAFVVLVVITLRWAIRRDRVGRVQWTARREAQPGSTGEGDPPASTGSDPGLQDRQPGAPG
jgi:hypothetical protein